MRKLILFFYLFCFALSGVLAQDNKATIDSLYNAYVNEKVDTSKVNLLISLCREYKNINRVKGIGFAREGLELATRIKFNKGICYASSLIAEYDYDQLNYVEALKNFLNAASAGEQSGQYVELSHIYNAMGVMYSIQKRNEQSLKYFLKVAKIAEEHQMKKRIPVAYNNIGIAYKNLGRYTEAKKYYQMALEEFEKNGFKKGIASVHSNLGIISHQLKNDEEALEHYKKAMQEFHDVKDTVSEAGIYTNVGELYRDEKEYTKALEYYQKGLEKAQQFHNVNFTDDAYDGISKLYAAMHDYEKAYKFNQLHLALKDSINNEDGMRQVQEMEKRLDNEKQEKEIQILKQNKEIQDLKVRSQNEKLKQGRVVLYSVIGVLLIVLAMSFFIFKAYRQIKQTNLELAEKKQEIQDSINYAKNIQEAMLPEVNVLRKYFPGAFGLFLPKDVVSGDFYWFHELNDVLYFAVADCTGHGVPGGFMSMIGIDKLNQSLADKKIESPSAILTFLNRSIKDALKQRTDTSLSKDGMDIALCSYDRNKKLLRYAGANRPLWVLRNKEIIEYKPTKASIGGYTPDDEVFAEYEVQLLENDSVYTFSDGFADQFGGPNKKKFMSKQLRQLLIEHSDVPMSKQEALYEKIFNDWRGNIQQVDDVLLFGVKI